MCMRRSAGPGLDHCAAASRGAARALGRTVGRKTRSQAATAPRVRRPTKPRATFAVISNPFCLDSNPIAGRYNRGRARGDDGGGDRRCDERYWTFQSRPGNVRHGNGCRCLAQSDTYRLLVDQFGRSAGFASLAAEGLVELLILAVFLPETKDEAPNLARRTPPSSSRAWQSLLAVR
jgi:hypothetical protein